MPSIQFLGAAGTVTGSRYVITTERARVLVDCGLFQGPRDLKALNWQPLPFPPASLDAVVITHAHLDHAGYFPRLVADGYRGKAFCTTGTADLLSILLPDSGFLQEEEAQHANRKGWSRHQPASPLYTMLDAQRSLRSLRPVAFGVGREVAPGVHVTFHPAGHILGSAIAEVRLEEAHGVTTLVFSGDLGRAGAPLMRDPTRLAEADYVVVESTYGDRRHPPTPPADQLARVIREAAARGGMLLLPAFAVGRTQELLYVIRELEDAGAVPPLDVFVDSPMAIDATAVTLAHLDELDAETAKRVAEGVKPLSPERLHIIRDAAQSRALNRITGPGIILSASGMCTGGRIKHHLRVRLPDARNTVCFVGFQAAGTRGRALQDGASMVHIFGERVEVRAAIERVEGFSAHADQAQLLDWLRGFARPPKRVFVTHGEPRGSEALATAIGRELGWTPVIPRLGELIGLGRAAEPSVTQSRLTR
jgi:metallo-beta-lactamase family protein